MSSHSIGARMATALGLVLTLLLGAALFGIAALYKTLGTYDTTVQQRVAPEKAALQNFTNAHAQMAQG